MNIIQEKIPNTFFKIDSSGTRQNLPDLTVDYRSILSRNIQIRQVQKVR
jgi:hypothetical protein